MGPEVALVDSGATCADQAARSLAEQGLLAQREQGSCRFFVSDSTEDFARLASIFLGGGVDGPVERVEIQKYGK